MTKKRSVPDRVSDLLQAFVFDDHPELIKRFVTRYPSAFRQIFKRFASKKTKDYTVNLQEGQLRFLLKDQKIHIHYVKPRHANGHPNFSLLFGQLLQDVMAEPKRDKRHPSLSTRGINASVLKTVDRMIDRSF